ncbi:MAG: hypothetical protein WBG82_13070 [Parvibaculum sp.]|uniref:hypothetical protein n=1 Tax=Parvibaculum sp. TaxID=2024848 RepID=UPI003C768C92
MFEMPRQAQTSWPVACQIDSAVSTPSQSTSGSRPGRRTAERSAQEVTINDAVDALDNAMNRALSLAMADANQALSVDQTNRNGLIVLTGTLTASRTLTLPANHRRLAIRNATSGGQDVRARHAGVGAEVAIVPGATVLVQGNGSDLYGVGGGAGALGDLTDVSIAGAANGDVLQFDGALWGAAGVGIFNRALLPFRGALARKTIDQSVAASTWTAIQFDTVGYDTDAFHAVGANTRLTVPVGVTKVALTANIRFEGGSANWTAVIRKNGSEITGGGAASGASGFTDGQLNLASAAVPVVAGDYFDVAVFLSAARTIKGVGTMRCWFAIQVVETQDAADPPADLTGFRTGQPGADEVLLRVPIARRTRMKVNLAGSQGVAGVAATAQTDFDIRRNGTSFATMRFAAAGTTATFIAASETVLEPGQVLSVVAPTTPDATLADIGFTLAGTLVV